jgi:hypothetical protein
MHLSYRNSEIHPATEGGGIASIAHVFTDAHSSLVFAYCEIRDGSSFWCNKTEDRASAELYLMFGMHPARRWLEAVASIPAQLRIAALQKTGETAAESTGGAA